MTEVDLEVRERNKDIQTTANIYLDVSDELAVNSVELLNKINND